MTYEELVAEVKRGAAKVSPEDITGHIAVQFNIEGEAEGAFYVEFNGGKVSVEPYEYYDRDILIVCSAKQAIAMSEAKLDPVKAMQAGELFVEGNIGRLELLKEMISNSLKSNKKKAATRAAASKSSAKKKADAAGGAKSVSKSSAKSTAKKPATKSGVSAKASTRKTSATTKKA